VLDGVVPLHKSLSPSQPSIRLPCFAPKQQRETQPASTARGAAWVTFLQARVMGAFQESVKVEVAADQVGRHGQELEILDGKRNGLIREREQLVGLTPCPAPVALASPFEFCFEHVSDYLPSADVGADHETPAPPESAPRRLTRSSPNQETVEQNVSPNYGDFITCS
jgi:hypothetical protein